MKLKLDKILSKFPKDQIEIVSGAAKGADALGEQYAKQRGYKLTRFPADWAAYDNSAGPRRNKEMAEYADFLVAFHDGFSRGTANMITTATDLGLVVRTIKY